MGGLNDKMDTFYYDTLCHRTVKRLSYVLINQALLYHPALPHHLSPDWMNKNVGGFSFTLERPLFNLPSSLARFSAFIFVPPSFLPSGTT